MRIRTKLRSLTGVTLLLLMFLAGITLVTLFSWRQQPAPAAAQQSLSKSPSEVVTDYWKLALAGDIKGANRYWSARQVRGDIIQHNPTDSEINWAVVISTRGLRLTDMGKEVAAPDGGVSVVTSVTPDGAAPVTLHMRNTLTRVGDEWRIVDISLTHSDDVR